MLAPQANILSWSPKPREILVRLNFSTFRKAMYFSSGMQKERVLHLLNGSTEPVGTAVRLGPNGSVRKNEKKTFRTGSHFEVVKCDRFQTGGLRNRPVRTGI